MALALGVSVASAIENTSTESLQDFLEKKEKFSKSSARSVLPYAITTEPTMTVNGVVYDKYKNPVVGTTSTKDTTYWAEGSDGLIYLATNNSATTDIHWLEVKFDGGISSTLWTGAQGTVTMFVGNAEGTNFVFNSQGNGIQIGNDGNGEMIIQFVTTNADNIDQRSMTANMTFSNALGGPALKGDLLLKGGYASKIPENPVTHFTASFNGNLDGDFTVDLSPNNASYHTISKLTFLNNSSITGNVFIKEGITTLLFANGNIQGNVTTQYEKTALSILRTTNNDFAIGNQTTRDADLIKGKVTINNGTTLKLGYANDVTGGNRTISINPENTSAFAFGTGSLYFENMKRLNLIDNNGDKKTLTLATNGLSNAYFNFGRDTLALNDGTTIIKGNLSVNNGNFLRLSFIDDGTSQALSQDNLKTFVVDGSISSNASGISFFYNERTDSFEAKVKANDGFTQTGGYIGRNDAFFGAGTFTTDKNNTALLTIQGTSNGVSHLRFSDAVTVSKGIGSNGDSDIGTDIYFYNTVTINAFDTNTKIDDTSVGKAIYAKQKATNTIHFAKNSVINGDIFAAYNSYYDIPVNTIIATDGLTLGSTSLSAMTILLQDQEAGYGGGGKNLFDITGTTAINSNLAIQANSRPTATNYDTVAMHNIFKFNGAVNLASGKTITSLDTGVGNFGKSGANTYNVLSFEADSNQTITIGKINDSTFVNNRATGYNYIGKGYTTGSGTSLALNSNLFNSTGVSSGGTKKFWNHSDYQANVTLTVTGDIFAKQGSNYINVNTLSAGTITSNGNGKNFINAITFSSGNISTTTTGNYGSETHITAQAITLTGDIETGFGDVYLHSTKTATLKNISATDVDLQGAGVNNILLEGTSASIGAKGTEANISVNMTHSDDTSIGHNAIVANATTNTLKLGTISLSGVGGEGRESKTHNIISLNKDSGNTLTATSITSANGMSVIGKNIVNNSGKYNSSLFDSIDDRNPSAKSNFTNLVLTDTYMANVELALANGTNDALVANGGGSNYINTSSVTITGDIEANGGSNFIRTKDFSITRELSSTSGINYLYTSKSATLGNITTTTSASSGVGGNSYLVFNGDEVSIGKDGAKATINTQIAVGKNTNIYGYTTIVANATTNTMKLNTLSLSGMYGNNQEKQTFNILSFNNANATNTLSATSITSGNGNTIIGKNVATASGHNTTLFSNTDQRYPIIKDNFSTVFMTDAYMAKGTYTISNSTSDALVATDGGFNHINVESLNITGNIKASNTNGSASNNIYANTLTLAGKITAIRSTNTITAKNGTATIEGISTITYKDSGVGNAINLGNGSITINARSGETDSSYTDINGKAIYAKNENNSNSITASSITVNGDIYANTQASNSLTASSSIAVTGNINGGATNNFTLTADRATLTLNGLNGGTTHEITSLTATTSGTNTLTLDNTASSIQSGSIQTTIGSVTNGANLAVVMKGKDIAIGGGSGSREEVALILTNANGTTLKSIALADGSDGGHRVAFKAGADNKVLEAINIGQSQSFTLELYGSGTSLNLAGLNGASNINIEGAGAKTLSGGSIDTQSLTLADQSELILKNTSTTIALLNATNASTNGTTLTLGGSDKNATNATVSKLNGGDNLSVKFNGQGEGKGANLAILADNSNGKTINLKGVSVESGSTHNTLDLSSLTTAGIDSAVRLAGGTGLTIKLKDTDLTVTGGTDSRLTETEAKGALTIRVDSGVGSTSTATSSLATSQAGEELNITSLDMVGDGTTKVTFKSNANIGTLEALASAGNELTIGESGDTTVTINTTNSTLSKVTLAGDTVGLTINGGTQTINNLVTTATTANKLTLSNNNLTLGTITNTGSNDINVELTKSTLSLASSSTISSLKTDGKSVINLAVGHNGTNKANRAGQSRTDAPTRNKLTITTLDGNLSANVFVSKSQADQIQIDNATSGNILTLYARGSASDIISITRGDNVLVADTQKANGNVTVEGGTSDIGGLVVKLNVEEDATKGKWYVGKTEVKGVDQSFQEVASSALAVNYDLYLANFNSLNKRMGELRDNPYNQGVWARVFGGAMSNDIGAGSKTQYVTAQAGYDYSLTLGDARNYMGIAVAYGSSTTKANEGVGLTNAFLDNINSQMAEVGIYNSYVADSGWYNDTIFKFDYIMSDFDITVQGGGSSTHNTNNFAMVLSDEFGYRYKFAENAKGNWYIDPQVEMAFGYFNQSDFNQAIANNFTTVEASQDAILTLRTRAGLSLGKKFISAKGFATLYVGAFYEYDYIDGGNAQAQVLSVSNSLDRLESNGRAIVNIGSNIELTDGVRMYIDVEKSFGDKQRTDMQFNFGARYSFGDKTPSTSYLADEKKRREAPLKVEEKPQAQESKAETPANTEVKQ